MPRAWGVVTVGLLLAAHGCKHDPPKLAAIGFVFPPMTTLVFIPFAVIKPLATSLIALPLMSCLFMAGMAVMVNRTFARCEMPVLLRLPMLALFLASPMIVFYGGNGMSEAVYLFFLGWAIYCFIAWYLTVQPRFLIGNVRERTIACERFDASHVGPDRALTNDLDRPDEPERAHVRAAAQLDRRSGFEHPHTVAVLLSEERDRSTLFGVGFRHLDVRDRSVGDDLLVGQLLDLDEVVGGHRLVVTEVES